MSNKLLAQGIPERTSEEIKEYIEHKHQGGRNSLLHQLQENFKLEGKKAIFDNNESKVRDIADTLKNAFTLPDQLNDKTVASGLQNTFQDSLNQMRILPLLKGVKLQESIISQMILDCILSYFGESQQNGILTYYLNKAGSDIWDEGLSFHMNDKKISHLAYFYSSRQKVSIHFDQFDNSIKEKMLDIDQFVTHNADGWQAAKPFARYQIITQP